MSDVQKPDEECRILIAREAQIMAARLGERNSYILQNRLLSDNPKTFREIGETWGVSGQRVRQISMRIRNQLIYRMKWVVSTPIKLELADVLDQPFEWLDLGVRAHNCLQNEGIQSIGELIQKTESDLLRNRHFGPKSLNEINARLAELGLCLKKEA
jgi:hypothetical protein